MSATAEEVKAAHAKADGELYTVAAKQIAFKPGVVTNIMLDIVTQLVADRIKWGDEMELPTHGTPDSNCVGTAFKLVMRAGLVTRMEQHRRSIRAGQKGRLVWKYRLNSEPLARTFLGRHHRTSQTKGQPELKLD